jgi:hypothetical protein
LNVKIEVFKNNTSIFKGKLLNLPFKEDVIIQKSIELFGDDEPCVIHQSYVIRQFAEEMAQILDPEINYQTYPEQLKRLDFENIEAVVIKRRTS